MTAMTDTVDPLRLPPELASQPPAVAALDLVRRFGEGEAAVEALRGVSLRVPTGQFLAVMGPSGSGKSTLLHLLAGLDKPSAGTVRVDGHPVTGASDREMTRLRRHAIGFIFQAFNLLPTLTVEENVALPLVIAGHRIDDDRLSSVLARVGLEDRRRHRPAQLSGGQQQRVAIARALLSRPAVLFADEPTGNLDSATGRQVLEMLRETCRDDGQTTVMVTHDPRAAASADRVIYLTDGLVVADLDGPSEARILELMQEVAR